MGKKFISYREFESIYGEKALNAIQCKKSVGNIPSCAFASNGKKFKLIDVNFFLKRQDFVRKVWLNSHDNYYFLTRYISTNELCFLLNKIDGSISKGVWNSFIHNNLFLNGGQGLSDYRIKRIRWAFYRYSRWLIRGLFILANVKPQHRDISVLLDRH